MSKTASEVFHAVSEMLSGLPEDKFTRFKEPTPNCIQISRISLKFRSFLTVSLYPERDGSHTLALCWDYAPGIYGLTDELIYKEGLSDASKDEIRRKMLKLTDSFIKSKFSRGAY